MITFLTVLLFVLFISVVILFLWVSSLLEQNERINGLVGSYIFLEESLGTRRTEILRLAERINSLEHPDFSFPEQCGEVRTATSRPTKVGGTD